MRDAPAPEARLKWPRSFSQTANFGALREETALGPLLTQLVQAGAMQALWYQK
jgi:hypothetical protein